MLPILIEGHGYALGVVGVHMEHRVRGQALFDVVQPPQQGRQVLPGGPVDGLPLKQRGRVSGGDLLPGVEQRGALLEVAQGRPGQQAVPIGEAFRRTALVMVFQAAELVVPGGEAELLEIQGGEIPAQGQGTAGGSLIQGPDIVGVQHVEGIVQLVIRGGIEPLAAEGQNVVQMNALAQPDSPGTYPLHRLAGLLPEGHGNSAGYVAAEPVHILGPVAQGLDLIVP